MHNYLLTLEYEGTLFCGWQKQPRLPSVQDSLEKASLKLTGEQVTLVAAGRTDAGVHATGQMAHVCFEKELSLDTLRRGLNFHLKDVPVKVLSVQKVSTDFHARFSARMRHYEYIILNRPSPPVLEEHKVWWIPKPLNIEAMARGALILQGHHDFSAFRTRECQAKTPEKTLHSLTVNPHHDHIYFQVSARSFLHNQVRIMVGTLKKLGDGYWPPEHIQHILASKNREQAGPTAPPHGLYFRAVDYPSQSFQNF